MECKLCESVCREKYQLGNSRVQYCNSCEAYFCESSDYNYDDSDDSIISYYKNARDYIEWRQHKVFSYIKKHFDKQSGLFLDIGSGIGYSLKVAQELGWQAVGVEPNRTLQEYSKSELNLNSIHGYLSQESIKIIQEELTEDYADYILIDNVLEHIPDPVTFFQHALCLLRPGGVMLVAVPPVDWLRLGLVKIPRIRQRSTSAQINLFYDPEQHVNYFSRQAIRVLVDKVGGCELTNLRFSHSELLNGWPARILQFETGYYFIVKDED